MTVPKIDSVDREDRIPFLDEYRRYSYDGGKTNDQSKVHIIISTTRWYCYWNWMKSSLGWFKTEFLPATRTRMFYIGKFTLVFRLVGKE